MRSLIHLGAALLIAAPALAQTPSPTPAPSITPAPSTTPAQPSASTSQPSGAMAARPIGFVTEPSRSHWLGSKLDGANVYNTRNEKLGDIADVLLTDDGRVEAIILGVGGLAGIGTRYVAVAPASLRMTRENNDDIRLVLDTTTDQLRNAPEFRYTGKARTAR
jgi:sporulation protein YlmC with PRC-barrel domain